MASRTAIADISAGLVSLVAGGVLGLLGAAIFGFGVLGFVVDVHGGLMIASVMTVFGSALLCISYFVVRYGLEQVRHRRSSHTDSL